MTHAQIEALIPHAGRMCLLDTVLHFDAEHCHAQSHSHRHSHGAADHPLFAHGRLGMSVAIEYAAQCMAIHGALTANQDQPKRGGRLLSVRSVTLHRPQLDLQEPLLVKVHKIMGDEHTQIYDFQLLLPHKAQLLCDGRASVMLTPQ